MVYVNGQVLNALMIELIWTDRTWHKFFLDLLHCQHRRCLWGLFWAVHFSLTKSHHQIFQCRTGFSHTGDISAHSTSAWTFSVLFHSYSCKLLIRSCLLHPFAFVVHSIAKISKMHVDICRSCLAPSGRNPQCTCCRHPSELQPWTSRWYRHPSQVDK